jgi:phosphatidylinositol alpha-1,6-mannosyltransferase
VAERGAAAPWSPSLTGGIAVQRSDARGPGILVVTGHFPPSRGGVQTYTYEFARRLPAGRVIVLAPDEPGAAAFDAALPFVVRRYRRPLLSDPATPRLLSTLVRDHGIAAAWISAAAPLAALAPVLRRAGVRRIVASSHGQEVAWARLPPTRALFTAATRSIDVLSYLGGYTRSRLAHVVSPGTGLMPLPGGVDPHTYQPSPGALAVRLRHRLGRRPVVVSVSRLVARKGHDRLIDAWPAVLDAVPDAALLVVGDGPARVGLQRRAARNGVGGSVIFTGAVPSRELPAHLAVGDVFALPVRDRWAGLEVEGLGLAILEASATGLPVVVGRSGGTPDAVVDGVTGHLVDGRDSGEIARAVAALLADPARAEAMGAAGRAWVVENWGWDALAERLLAQLTG